MLLVMHEVPARPTALRRRAWRFACGAGLLGGLYAAVSAYWGAGGTALLDTIGGTLEREGRARAAGVLAVVWTTVVLSWPSAASGSSPSRDRSGWHPVGGG